MISDRTDGAVWEDKYLFVAGQFQAASGRAMLVALMSGFDGPIHLVITASRTRRRLVALAHAVSVVVLGVALPASAAVGALLLAVLVNGALAMRRCAPCPDDVGAVLLDASGGWQVTLVDGRVLAATLSGRAFVTTFLTAFALHCGDGRTRHVVLLPDNSPAAPRRRLRVRLVHAHVESGQGGEP